jgi:hypothetical protein
MTSTQTATAPETATAATSRLRTLGVAMIVLLLAQFLVGMANTFWLKTPESGPAAKTATPAGLLMGHVTLAFVLPVLAIWILVVAVRARARGWVIASIVGLIGIVVAFGGGSSFINEVSNDGASFTMAVGWAVAMAAYALVFVPAASVSDAAAR